MTYDDWKTTDDTPEDEPTGWCAKCEHYECDCPCCTEPAPPGVPVSDPTETER